MKLLTASAATVLFFAGMTGACLAGSTIKDTSFKDRDGHRIQQLKMVVEAPVAAVWSAFTTDDGLKSWVAPVAHVELANDGMMEASYSITAKIGDPDNIKNQIIAYVPERLLVYHNVHVPKGAPPDFALLGSIRTIVEMSDLGDRRTRITESGVGYGEGASYDALFKHFSAGNIEEFTLLARSLEGHKVDWKAQGPGVKASVGDTSQ
jgi:uncharacterized protein YndB with AHSA1/START domain